MAGLTTIGFDADDTLWQNERHFKFTQKIFADLLAEHADAATISEKLLTIEKKNLAFYGFGIKGFTLSMLETAIEITEGKAPAATLKTILDAGRDMLHHPVELLPHAKETLQHLSQDYRLVLITKGDLFDQERKLAQSGLGDFFHGVEIVSDKSPTTYASAFQRHGSGPENAVMAGNSLKSDVIPALAAGAWGIYVPHALTWAYEHETMPEAHPRFREIPHLGALPDLLKGI